MAARGTAFLSVAAGVGMKAYEASLGGNTAIVRCMPNTPALVGAGAAAFSRGKLVGDADAGLASRIFGAVGTGLTLEALRRYGPTT